MLSFAHSQGDNGSGDSALDEGLADRARVVFPVQQQQQPVPYNWEEKIRQQQQQQQQL